MSTNAIRWIAGTTLAVTLAVAAWAADANGKWTWTQKRGQNDVMMTLELKQDGEKLTGTVGAGERKTEIKEGTIKNNEVAFVVVRERNGQEVKTNYKGKLDGDTIKGNISLKGPNGQDRNIEWTAMRAK
jgi:hypothetical protein